MAAAVLLATGERGRPVGRSHRPAGLPPRAGLRRGAAGRWPPGRTSGGLRALAAATACGPRAHLHRRGRPPRPLLLLRQLAGLRPRRPRDHRRPEPDRHRRTPLPRRTREATTAPMPWPPWSRCSAPIPDSLGLVTGIGMHMTHHGASLVVDPAGRAHSFPRARSARAAERTGRPRGRRRGQGRDLLDRLRPQRTGLDRAHLRPPRRRPLLRAPGGSAAADIDLVGATVTLTPGPRGAHTATLAGPTT